MMSIARSSRGPFGLRLPLEVVARIDAIGRRFEVSRSTVIKALLAVALGESEEVEDAVRRKTVRRFRPTSAPTS